MARPLIPVETIYTRALELLDAEGIDALQARKLAADLKISTRTLYQQVGNREQLIRALVARHFSQLRLDFRAYKTFDSTALHWSQALHDTLRAHPYLTELMEIDDRKAVEDYVNELVKAALREGFPRRTAIECCRALVNVTINHTIVEVRAVREPEHSPGTAAEFKKIERNFPMTIRWILAGVRAELESNRKLRAKRIADSPRFVTPVSLVIKLPVRLPMPSSVPWYPILSEDRTYRRKRAEVTTRLICASLWP